jgi:hypothetical protein
VFGEYKLGLWAKTNWGFGKKQVGVLGKNKLRFWAKPSWSVGLKQVGVLGENKLECWANINRGFGQKQIEVLGESKFECWAKTYPIFVSIFMSFMEGHRNSQEGRKRPQDPTFHVRPLRCLQHPDRYATPLTFMLT